MNNILVKQLIMKVRNLFSVADFQKRYEDGRLQVKTLSGRVLEQKESFPYGFIAKAKTGRVLVFCQGGNFDGFEILPLTADDDTILSKLKENDVAVYTTNNGNIEVIPGGSGKIFMGNDSKNMCALLLGLIDEIKNMVTFGSSTSHSVDPATQIKFETYKNQVKQLFMESI